MEIAITKISRNGQIVIPSEIRTHANIVPSTKFLVFNKNGDILLKKIHENTLESEMNLIKKINQSEEQIKNGEFTKINSRMNENKIDTLLMK